MDGCGWMAGVLDEWRDGWVAGWISTMGQNHGLGLGHHGLARRGAGVNTLPWRQGTARRDARGFLRRYASGLTEAGGSGGGGGARARRHRPPWSCLLCWPLAHTALVRPRSSGRPVRWVARLGITSPVHPIRHTTLPLLHGLSHSSPPKRRKRHGPRSLRALCFCFPTLRPHCYSPHCSRLDWLVYFPCPQNPLASSASLSYPLP